MTHPDFQNSHERENFQDVIRKKLENPLFLPSLDEIICAFTDEDSNPLLKNWIIYLESGVPKHEIWNQEYIVAFSDYLAERCDRIEGRATILDVGASDGVLGYHLKNKEIISIDTNPLNERVEKMNYKEAIEKYNPEIVIISWMPDNED